MFTLTKLREPGAGLFLIVVMFSAFCVMLTLFGVVGYYAISPLQTDITRLKNSTDNSVTRKEWDQRKDFIDRRIEQIEHNRETSLIEMQTTLNNRLDNFRDDMNNRIGQIQNYLDATAPRGYVRRRGELQRKDDEQK